MNGSLHTAEDCFMTVHDNLQSLPDKFCYWKKESSNGKKISKSLEADYRPIFSFVRDVDLRTNLAELRMCLDYHRSIFEFLKPGLVFGWQHKLILCQMTAEIYEGLLFDLFEYKTSSKKNDKLNIIIATEKLKNHNTGLGYFLDIFNQSGLFAPQSKWKKYLNDINYVRNTIHPKSLNSIDSSYKKNRVIQGTVELLFTNLDKFIRLIQRAY